MTSRAPPIGQLVRPRPPWSIPTRPAPPDWAAMPKAATLLLLLSLLPPPPPPPPPLVLLLLLLLLLLLQLGAPTPPAAVRPWLPTPPPPPGTWRPPVLTPWPPAVRAGLVDPSPDVATSDVVRPSRSPRLQSVKVEVSTAATVEPVAKVELEPVASVGPVAVADPGVAVEPAPVAGSVAAVATAVKVETDADDISPLSTEMSPISPVSHGVVKDEDLTEPPSDMDDATQHAKAVILKLEKRDRWSSSNLPPSSRAAVEQGMIMTSPLNATIQKNKKKKATKKVPSTATTKVKIEVKAELLPS